MTYLSMISLNVEVWWKWSCFLFSLSFKKQEILRTHKGKFLTINVEISNILFIFIWHTSFPQPIYKLFSTVSSIYYYLDNPCFLFFLSEKWCILIWSKTKQLASHKSCKRNKKKITHVNKKLQKQTINKLNSSEY